MSRIVLLTSAFPAELAAGALLKTLLPNEDDAKHHAMRAEHCTNRDLFLEALSKMIKEGDDVKETKTHVYMIGTYWESHLPTVASKYPKVQFVVYCFGKLLNDKLPPNVSLVPTKCGNDYKGPCSFVLSLVEKDSEDQERKDKLKSFRSECGRALDLMDLRGLSQSQTETQSFYTGLTNACLDDSVSEYELFCRLWKGKFCMVELIRHGEIILASQKKLIRAHVKHTHRLFEFKDKQGFKVSTVITETPYLTNLTHEVLNQVFPKADVTVVLRVHLDEKEGNSWGVSYRSYTDRVNVGEYAKRLFPRGDGSKAAAGGTMNAKLFNPQDLFQLE